MSNTVAQPVEPRRFSRVLGSHGDPTTGPRLVVLGGIHGNEPAGVRASLRVLETLRRGGIELAGQFTALAGNLGALACDQRFVQSDLNRRWSRRTMEQLAAQDPRLDCAEEAEQRELKGILDDALGPSNSEAYFIDLHSFSAQGSPFTVMGDTLRNRELAFRLPIPVILGLEETIEGTLLEYLGEEGRVAIAVEGGQHQDPNTIDNHEAVIWLALVATGCLQASQVPDLEHHQRRLARAAEGVPNVVEIRHRHPVELTDDFRMEPGFRNFQPVHQGQLLALDRGGPITSPMSAMVLMPLYQEQGEDGFFLGRRVRLFWLKLSALLRRLRLERFVDALPGVDLHPHRPRTLVINHRVARWWVVQIFHLLGYRRARDEGERMVFVRRRSD